MTPIPPGSMSEGELLVRARQAMSRATSLPLGSLSRTIQWGVFDTLMAELNRRAVRYLSGRMER